MTRSKRRGHKKLLGDRIGIFQPGLNRTKFLAAMAPVIAAVVALICATALAAASSNRRAELRTLLSGAPFDAVQLPAKNRDELSRALAGAVTNDNEKDVVCLCMANVIDREIVDSLPLVPGAAAVRLHLGFENAFPFKRLKKLVSLESTVHYALALAECITTETENEYAHFLNAHINKILVRIRDLDLSFSHSLTLPALALQRHGYADAARQLLVHAINVYEAEDAEMIMHANLHAGTAPFFALDPSVVTRFGKAGLVSALLWALYSSGNTDSVALITAIRAAVAQPQRDTRTNSASNSTSHHPASTIVEDLAQNGMSHRAALLCALLPIHNVHDYILPEDVDREAIERAMQMVVSIARRPAVRHMLFFNPASILISLSQWDPELIATFPEYEPYVGGHLTWPSAA